MFVGFILVLVGVLFLMKNMGYLATIDWNLVWPVILIALGLSFMFNRAFGRDRSEWREVKKEEEKR